MLTGFPSRTLPKEFLQEWIIGSLLPLLELVKIHKDLIMQFRGNSVDIYCKGNVLCSVSWKNGRSHLKFNDEFTASTQDKVVESRSHCESIIVEEVATIVHNIATGARLKTKKPSTATESEIEFEQLFIRQNYYSTRIFSEFFPLDRQVSYNRRRWDVTGVFWPFRNRSSPAKLFPTIVEFKHGTSADAGNVAAQLSRYQSDLETDPSGFSHYLKGLLVQQDMMGLIRGASENALQKLTSLEVSDDPRDFRYLVVLSDYSPMASTKFREKIAESPLASRTKVYQVGYALWDDHAI